MYQKPRFSHSYILYLGVLKEEHLQLVKAVQWQANKGSLLGSIGINHGEPFQWIKSPL